MKQHNKRLMSKNNNKNIDFVPKDLIRKKKKKGNRFYTK